MVLARKRMASARNGATLRPSEEKNSVMPAKAGIQYRPMFFQNLDSDFRRNDNVIRDFSLTGSAISVCQLNVRHFAKEKQDTASVPGDLSINNRSLHSDQRQLIAENTNFLSEALHRQLPSQPLFNYF